MLLALLILAAAPKQDPRLVGTWRMNGESFMTLNANGTGVMEGDSIKWKSDGARLTITDEDGEAETIGYTFQGETLNINMGGMSLPLQKGGAPVKKQARAKEEDEDDAAALAMAQQWVAQQQGQQGQPGAPTVKKGTPNTGAVAPQPAGNDQLSRLLLSSNWCWLRYSNGNSYTQKVHFNANGTWQDFSESDIYSNNVYAQTTAQATSNRTNGGQWAVKNGQFYLSAPENPQLVPVPLTITRNSNGYPIITAEGREYSMCN